jgi:CheY-like chemotaxis protein
MKITRPIRIRVCPKQYRAMIPGAATSGHRQMQPHAHRAPDELISAVKAARVLIVDDDVAEARSLAGMLGAAGYWAVREVHSAAVALAAAVEFRPGIIFLDIELPDMSGYDAALLLHQNAVLQDTRLIALTDSIEHTARETARAAGFERYLVKPVTNIELRKVLRKRVRAPVVDRR